MNNTIILESISMKISKDLEVKEFLNMEKEMQKAT